MNIKKLSAVFVAASIIFSLSSLLKGSLFFSLSSCAMAVTKAIFNSAVVFIIYKPIITAMRNAGFIVSEVKREASANRRPNYSVMIIAAIVGIVALLFFFLKLNGSFTFG